MVLHEIKPSMFQWKELDETARLWHLVAENNKSILNFQLIF
jgi:hypothetical protein